jgi:MFS family permease
VFVFASVAGGLAVEPGRLIASRVVQGVRAAIVAPAGLSLLVTSWTQERERSHALGIYGAALSTGFASGAVLGGVLVEVHQGLFIAWAVLTGLHVLGRTVPALQLTVLPKHTAKAVDGARSRAVVLIGTLVVAGLVAALVLSASGPWR